MKKFAFIIFFFAIFLQYLDASLPLDCTGDIRAKWHSVFHDQNVHRLKTEINICLDYEQDMAWLKTKAKACTSDFRDSSFSVEKAVVGYNLLDLDYVTIDIEGGRNRQDSLFESKLQHDSYFNGLNVIYCFKIPNYINFTLNGGPHMIDSSHNHIGFIGCAHWKAIGNTPFEFKYSMAHWGNHHDQGQRYAISQCLLKYKIAKGGPYLGYLNNHRASKLANGLYFGYTLGSIEKAHDYLIDANVQLTQSNAIPEWDSCGLKKGIQLKAVYAITETFSVQIKTSCDFKDEKQILEVSGIYIW